MTHDAQVKKIISLAIEHQNKPLTITTAESCTGGLISAAITNISGSSSIFEYGFVTYSNAAKINLLGLRPEPLEKYGAVSTEVVSKMADNALRISKADLAIAVSGIAGPSGAMPFKPVGLVCFAITSVYSKTKTLKKIFPENSRSQIREKTVSFALDLILEELNNQRGN